MDRRSVITLMAAGGLAACTPSSKSKPKQRKSVEKISYGDDPSQFGELSRAHGASKGLVVILHGGFWRSQYDLSLGRPLAASLITHGWDAYNLEYRRIGNGGGWPETFDDVADGIDALAKVDGLDNVNTIALGHSAGGHLAVWAAGRPKLAGTKWASPAVSLTAAISQAGVLDLVAARKEDLGAGAVQALMGGTVDDRYKDADPTSQIPLDVRVRCIHGKSDDTVPLSQSIGYVDRARAAGADAELVEVEGDHFVVIDPTSRAWGRTLEILEAL
jgi:acetyl esterase/lipase